MRKQNEIHVSDFLVATERLNVYVLKLIGLSIGQSVYMRLDIFISRKKNQEESFILNIERVLLFYSAKPRKRKGREEDYGNKESENSFIIIFQLKNGMRAN